MKHILLIANLSGRDTQLLRYAARFCKHQDLRLHVLEIEENKEAVLLSSPYYFNKMGFIASQEYKEKRKELETFVSQSTKDLIDSTWVSTKIVKGNIESSLKTFINQEKIDLIIVGQSLFKENIGENSVYRQLLLNVSELPTLIIPNNQTYNPFPKIAYLTTLEGDDYRYLNWIKENFSQSKIDALHFEKKDVSVETLKKIKYLKSELGELSFNYEKREKTIESFVRNESTWLAPEFNLIALRTRKRNFWERLLDPSTALNLILKIDTPTLLFKYKAEDS